MRFLKKIRTPPAAKTSCLVFVAGLITGAGYFVYYYAQQLTLAHYDAKAHLLVARRIVDSLEPGYGQIGVNWLPVIHLIYLPFVVFESQYRSGLLPSLISVFAFALSVWLTYRISYRLTSSNPAGLLAAFVLMANPNLLYLQSCPLTEPVYMALMLLAVDGLISWRQSDVSTLPWLAAAWGALGSLCRYEGWYLFAGILLLLAYDAWSKYLPRFKALQAIGVFLTVFGVPAIVHFGLIYIRLGDNFFRRVAEGNPDPYITYKRPVLSVIYHWAELSQMAALIPLLMAAAGLIVFLAQRKEIKSRLSLLLLWLPSLINISALYWGMIYRVRYSVLLLPAVAVFGSLVLCSARARVRTLLLLSGAAIALPWLSWYIAQTGRKDVLVPGPGAMLLPGVALLLFMLARVRHWDWQAMLILCILSMQIPPLAREYHPMMVETLEHEFIEPERREVLRFLQQNYDGRRILIDMGKLAPLVYDSGLPVREFVYNEGGEVLWHEAIGDPVHQVGWLCAQKGDAVESRMLVDPHWADGYALALKTENFSVFRLKD
jgi:hypothetical protein